MIVLDANVLIAHLDVNDAHNVAASKLLESSVDDTFAMGSINLAEALFGHARRGATESALRAIETLEIVEVPMFAGSGVELARLSARTGCRLPDCCVLLAAQQTDGIVASFDQKVVRAAASIGLRTVATG